VIFLAFSVDRDALALSRLLFMCTGCCVIAVLNRMGPLVAIDNQQVPECRNCIALPWGSAWRSWERARQLGAARDRWVSFGCNSDLWATHAHDIGVAVVIPRPTGGRPLRGAVPPRQVPQKYLQPGPRAGARPTRCGPGRLDLRWGRAFSKWFS